MNERPFGIKQRRFRITTDHGDLMSTQCSPDGEQKSIRGAKYQDTVRGVWHYPTFFDTGRIRFLASARRSATRAQKKGANRALKYWP